MDLSGACGILVNVTAGKDLSIGEFEEVGTTVKEFASEEATVVIGTVIDADMEDSLRVTKRVFQIALPVDSEKWHLVKVCDPVHCFHVNGCCTFRNSLTTGLV